MKKTVKNFQPSRYWQEVAAAADSNLVRTGLPCLPACLPAGADMGLAGQGSSWALCMHTYVACALLYLGIEAS